MRTSALKPSRQWLFPFCNTAFRGTLAMFADIDVQHRERLQVDGPVIYVCNHLSNLDPPIVASLLPRRSLFLAKRELFNNPLFTFLLKGWGAYPVSRYSADLHALRWARTILAAQRAVVMFPEGTRSRNLEGLKKAQIGTALLATQSGATLVPIGMYGTDDLQNILKVLMPIAKIRVSVGEPFKVRTDISDRATLEQATEEIMSRVAINLPPKRRGIYADKVSDGFELTTSIENLRDTESAPEARTSTMSSPTSRRSV